MLKKISLILLVLVFLFGSASWLYKQSQKRPEINFTPQTTRAQTIVVGSISKEPVEEVLEFQPFIDYLAAQLNHKGIIKGEVVVAGSVSEMAKLVREKKVDIYIDSPFPAFAVSRLTQTEPLVSRWKAGVEKYYSVIFTRADSGIERNSDLKGKLLAFEDPFSTSGYFLPRAELLNRNYKLIKTTRNGSVPADRIGYFFAFDEEEIFKLVERGEVAAGALDVNEFTKLAAASDQKYKTLLSSIEVYRHIVTVRMDLPESLKIELKRILLSMDQTEAGNKVLAQFSKTAKFGEFLPDPASAFSGVNNLLDLVEEEIVRGE